MLRIALTAAIFGFKVARAIIGAWIVMQAIHLIFKPFRRAQTTN